MGRRRIKSLFGWIETNGKCVRYRYRIPGVGGAPESVNCHSDIKLALKIQREMTDKYENGELNSQVYELVTKQKSRKIKKTDINIEQFKEEWLKKLIFKRKKDGQTISEVESTRAFKSDVSRMNKFFEYVYKKIKGIDTSDINIKIDGEIVNKMRFRLIEPCYVESFFEDRLIDVVNSTANRDMDLIKPMLGYADKKKYSEESLAEDLKHFPTSNKNSVIVFENLETIVEMFKSCERVASDFLPLLWGYMKTGIRMSDGFAFEKSWVRRDINVVVVYTKKDDDKLTIRTDPDVHKLFLHLLKIKENETPYLFVDKNHEQWTESKIRRRTKLIVKDMKKKMNEDLGHLIRFNVFRHTVGSCITKAQGLAAASAMLGHSDYNLTKKHYANVLIEYAKLGDTELPYNFDKIHGERYWSKYWSKTQYKEGFTVISSEQLKSITA